VVHFLGKLKPWSYSYNAQSGEVKGHHSPAPGLCQLQPDYLRLWWELYSAAVLPALLKAYGDTPFNTGCVDVSWLSRSISQSASQPASAYFQYRP